MHTAKQPLKRLFRYMRPHKGHFYFSVSSSILNKVLDLMPPLIIGWAIDAVSNNTPAWIANNFAISSASGLALFFAAFILIVFAFESLFEWMFSYGFLTLAQKVQHDLRLDAYKHLQQREIAYFEQQRTGNIMSILNNDVNNLERFLSNTFNQIVQLATLYCFAALTMGMMSWKLTLISLFPIPLILIGSFFYQRKIGPFYKKIRETIGHLNSRLENNISGIMVIKSFTAERYEAQRVAKESEAYKAANYQAIRWNAAYIPLIRMFIALGFAVGMFVGIYWALTGQEGFTAGALTFFAMMIQRILWPITRLGQVVDEFERARASSSRIFGLMDSPNELPLVAQPIQENTIKGDISIQNIEFYYDKRMPILKGISFDLLAGQTIGIAGTTGAGKTTLIKLLLRLYDVTNGAIQIDQQDIREFDLTYLRRNIAVVSQDVYLFHGSIEENIAYGAENASHEQIVAAAKEAQLHDFIVSLPDDYQTLVGERGIKLSGGQRQRLSIARAILKNAPILILDEATSAVDTETERAIQENLNQLTQGRTALIIAHRLSTLRHANTILVLKDGQIAEQGSHTQLLEQKGIYAELWNIQTGAVVH